jgi:hypothetical protein
MQSACPSAVALIGDDGASLASINARKPLRSGSCCWRLPVALLEIASARNMREFNFYIDDSGTRRPDRNPKPTSFGGDWFALGGVIVASEAEAQARDLHAAFCARWEIDYPLHSVRIRHRSDKFAWVGQLSSGDQSRFYADLDALI